MGKKIRIISAHHGNKPLKEAEEMQEKYFGEHPSFYKKGHFCPIHAWESCKKKHSEDVLRRATVAKVEEQKESILANTLTSTRRENSAPSMLGNPARKSTQRMFCAGRRSQAIERIH